MDGAPHVLVVDDDPDTALFVRTVLQRGATPLTAAAGVCVGVGVETPSPAQTLAPDLAPGRPLPAEVPFTGPALVRYPEDVLPPLADVVAEEAGR